MDPLTEASDLVYDCVTKPGRLKIITTNHNALLIWAAAMREPDYAEARAKLISIGHTEADMLLVEQRAIEAARVEGHPIPWSMA